MPINQLFRTAPDREFTIELLNLYGIDDFTDTHFFTKNDLDKLDTIHKLNDMKYRLEEYYIPCKSKTYLQDITFSVDEDEDLTIDLEDGILAPTSDIAFCNWEKWCRKN